MSSIADEITTAEWSNRVVLPEKDIVWKHVDGIGDVAVEIAALLCEKRNGAVAACAGTRSNRGPVRHAGRIAWV